MTTVAYRDGILAADSRATRGDWIATGNVNKLFRAKDGVYAVLGSVGETTSLREWLENGRGGAPPKVTGNASVIHVSAEGVITVHEDGGTFVQPGPFMAWGSGAPVALGALHAGASAARAVEIAALVDPYTGGPVNWMTVEAAKPAWAAPSNVDISRRA